MLLATTSAWAAPDQNWTVQDTTNDCSGSVQQGTASCQDYATDLYENIDYSSNGALSSDIQTLRTGYDKKYFYFEVDFCR
ncbi:hypothetical protein A9Q98_08135 [Thalassotalea sp. 42_200_T64]|nr:hypothetical protein A9Q98_08135 [Thalassotalea sp. 42_200_T64]